MNEAALGSNRKTAVRRRFVIALGPMVVAVCLLLDAAGAAAADAASGPVSAADFSRMTLEELANIQISSVSKRAEPLSTAAASVYVITNEDIRRSGVTRLPEALRLAPNLQVAQVSASGYSITARGLNGSANKLLVMIDGRSVYTPLFAGVFWDVQDVMLEDVERIEVISGPGGTLWGTNAVNGVINVITRSAKNTQGGLAVAETGNRGSDAAVRHGGALDADGSYRIYGKYSDRNHTSTANGAARSDAWHDARAGFRTDWSHANDEVSVHGNVYNGAMGQPLPGSIQIGGVNLALDTISVSGANLTSHWARALGGGSSLNLQAYFDRTERNIPPTFGETLDIADLQFQHSLSLADTHALAWGAEYRYGRDRISNNTAFFAFLPANVDQTWLSLFAQDEIAIGNDLRLTLGARSERNDYTGNELLPNARLAWVFADDHLLWTAASRTVRVPSRLDHDAFIPANPPFVLAGGANVRSEVAKVYELGYRGQPTAGLSYSVTVFHTIYEHLRTQELAASRTYVFFGNEMEGTANGIEAWGTYQASRTWRLSAGFTALNEKLHLKPGSNDANAVRTAGKDPAQSWSLRSSHDLSDRSQFDVMARRVSGLSDPTVPHYLAVDFCYGWRPRKELELSVTGQNLFGPQHAEFGDPSTRSQFGRGVFIKITSGF